MCHRSARLTHHPITAHTLTWLLIAHTCIASAPSSRWFYKHTPHSTPVYGLVHMKWTLCFSSYTCVLASFVCLPPSCACLLRVLASFVCLPPSCACLSSMCILSSLHRVSLDYSINVCAVIHSSSVFATTSCKENTLITFLISTLKSLHWTSHLPAIDPFTSVAVNKFHLHSNLLCESFRNIEWIAAMAKCETIVLDNMLLSLEQKKFVWKVTQRFF